MSRTGVWPLHDGGYGVQLDEPSRQVLAHLAADLRGLVEGRNPAVDRLFPAAYVDDPEASAEYESMMRGELEAGRVTALRLLEETAGADRLTQPQADAWCGALNDLRLVIGEQAGVTEELYERDLDPTDPRAAQLSVYLWLTWLQSTVVDALAARLN
jgi:uncharacterized protein DUF2017